MDGNSGGVDGEFSPRWKKKRREVLNLEMTFEIYLVLVLDKIVP